MSWVTFIWSMTAGICLTLGAVHFLVWTRRRDLWANLVFSICAAAAAGYAVFDIVTLRVQAAVHFSRGWRRTFLGLVVFWTSAIEATAAAETGTDATSFVVKSWRTSDGLPQNSVTAIAQTREGYLWAGTRAGLARFDGVRFRAYGLADGLKSLAISCLAQDGQGGLWIGTRGGGLSHWREDGVISTLMTADGLAHNDVTALEPAQGGGIWVGSKGGLQHLGPGGFRPMVIYEGFHGEVVAMASDRDGGLWMTTSPSGPKPGLFRLYYCKGGRCEPVDGPPDERPAFREARGYSLVVDTRGDLWVSIGNGFVLRRHGTEWTAFDEKDGVPFSYVRCLTEGAPGEIWAAAQDAGLYVFRDGQFQTVLEADAACRVVARGTDGLIWAGTAANGLCRITPRRLQVGVVRQPDRWRGQVNGVIEAKAGELWIGTYGGGLYHGSLEQLEFVPGGKLLENRPHLTAGLKMSDGGMYFAGAGLLLHRAPATDELREILLKNNPTALCEGADGSLWLGTREGELLQLAGNDALPVLKATFPGLISGLTRGPGASLWVATQGAGFALWDADRVQRWTTAEGLPTDVLQTLHLDSEGTLWIGTAGGGLAWMRDGHLHSVNDQQGLGDNYISQILEDDQGNLWLGCNRGIFRVSKRELEDVAAGRAATIHPLMLDESDGMVTTECTGGYSPAGLRSQSGLLYFSTVRAVVAVNPAHFGPSASPPNVLIEGLRLDGKPTPRPSGPVSVPAGSRELEIHFTAFNYAKPEQLRFRYRLEGAHGDWVPAERERSVRYSQLPPGDYTFEVTAANPDLRWQPTGARLAFTVLPFYWQTLWFRAAVGLLLVAIGGGLVWWQTRTRLLNALARERLANELHENEERMSLAAEITNLGVWVYDLGRNEIWATDRWRALFSFTKTEKLTMEGFLQRVHPEDREAVRLSREKAIENGGGYETEYRVLLPDGKVRWIASRGGVELNGGGKPALVRGVSVDITARKQAEQETQLLQREIEHVSRVTTMGQLASSLAHEINQPLGAILRNTEAAELFLEHESPDLDEIRAILADIRRDDQRASAVIDRMRSLLRRREIQNQALDVAEFVGDVAALVRPDAVARRVKLEVEVPSGLPRVLGDRVHLQQVLLNLIVNGMESLSGTTEDSNCITVRARLNGEHVIEISVADSGPGIPADKLPHIFDPFFTTKPGGMGMGLAISRTIIEAHGGQFRAENRESGGAIFRFTLRVSGEGRVASGEGVPS